MNVTLDAARLASLYQTAMQESGVDNVQVAASEDGKSLTVTLLNGDGTVRDTQTIGGIPEIDVPSGATVGDSEKLSAFVSKLGEIVTVLSGLDQKGLDSVGKNFNEAAQRLVDEFRAAAPSGAGTGKVSAMFCIYRLMSLMLELAREQREVARAQREADTQMVLNEMETQRQSMIENAITGMITCVVVACIQLGVIGISASKDNKLNQMKEDNKLSSGQDTFSKVNTMAADSGNAQAMELSKTTAAQNLNATADKFVTSNTLPEAERTDALNAQKSIDSRFDEIQQNKTMSAEDKAAARQEVYEDLKAQRDIAKSEFLESAKTGKPDPQARQKLEIANAKVEYGAARLLADETPAGRKAFRETAKTDLHIAASVGGGLEAKIDQYASKKDTSDKVLSVLSSTIKELSNQATTLRDAQTKKYDQAVELSREQRETTKDLVATAMDMFKNMLNVLNSILESEKASFREIMG